MARNQPKVIVLTGATRGLGLAMAEKFIELGHTVLGCGRSREGAENLRRKFRPPHEFAAVDVALESQVEPWAARLLSSHGAPDLLINNAGALEFGSQVSADLAGIRREFEINYFGTLQVTRGPERGTIVACLLQSAPAQRAVS